MEILSKLFNGRGYIDGITIINLEGEVLFTAKLNEKLSGKNNSYQMVGKNFLDIYENLTPDTSSIIKAMKIGMPVYVEGQSLKEREREAIKITSLAIPIRCGERIVGAIDLSVLESESGKNDEYVETIDLSQEYFSAELLEKLTVENDLTYTINDIIAVDEKMKKAKKSLLAAAGCELPVFINGEDGTGKEQFVQAVHNMGNRKDKPFIAQTCASIPESLLESILFGTSDQAFIGAVENKGLLELADGGTLFLDEIDSMPIYLQAKLFSALQSGSFRSLGSKEKKPMNVRLIAGLNKNPKEAVRRGTLKQELFYCLGGMSITIPPLRERKKDLVSYIKVFVKRYNRVFNKKIQYISKELLQKLEEYQWPGNAQELEHVIAYGMNTVSEGSNTLRFGDVEELFLELSATFERVRLQNQLPNTPLKQAVDEYEKNLIEQALRLTKGNVSKAARILEVPRQTLQRKVKQYQIYTTSN